MTEYYSPLNIIMNNIFDNCKNTKMQGTVGLGRAISYFTTNGYTISLPLNDSQDYDLIVDDGEKLQRVQVKTTNAKNVSGTYHLNLRVLGGNSKKNFVHKTNSQISYDLLFAVCGDGRMYLIPKQSISHLENTVALGDIRKDFEVFV